MTYAEFERLFPNNSTCLDYLRDRFYAPGTACPKCGKQSKFHRIKGRSAYSCQYCRHQVYPTAGTIFHKSTTSLHLWFYAIYLMSSTRCGISAKQLEREIGVTYKTAHRMFKQIRTLLGENDDDRFFGEVEIDETYVGGKRKQRGQVGRPGADSGKAPVLGIVERGGRVRVVTVPDARKVTLMPHIQKRVLPGSMIFTDEWRSYDGLHERDYGHRRIKHRENIYVMGDVYTNTIEGFFGLFKNGVRGAYKAISTAYLQNYLDEYAFRYNHRHAINSRPMFWNFLDQVTKPGASGA
jgi:transposase-like protein